jgi:hypothetical protein
MRAAFSREQLNKRVAWARLIDGKGSKPCMDQGKATESERSGYARLSALLVDVPVGGSICAEL